MVGGIGFEPTTPRMCTALEPSPAVAARPGIASPALPPVFTIPPRAARIHPTTLGWLSISCQTVTRTRKMTYRRVHQMHGSLQHCISNQAGRVLPVYATPSLNTANSTPVTADATRARTKSGTK